MAKNQLIPGEPLRNGLDLIADKKTGALIVIGTSPKLDKLSSGGLNLSNCIYTPEMLSELSKMDGAIIVDSEVNRILKANVHLNPSDIIETSQTGTRHRTADRTRRRFDDAVLELGELEIENTLTNQQVLEVIQRGELLGRLSQQVRNEAVDLGEDSGLVMIQIDSLESGVRNTLNLVLKDHLPAKKYRNINKAVEELSNLTYEELNTIQHLGAVLFMEPLDEISVSKGYRVLGRLPGLPENLHDSLIQKFRTLPNLLNASTEKLFEVEGIGRSRAQQLRGYFDTLLKNIGFSYINGH